LGDIGKKFGFDATDNGYIKFNKLRVPRFNMLMRFARVSSDGTFERVASEVLMYAAMLLMRGTLCLYGTFFLSISTTIAVRYSSVRRQTANTDGYVMLSISIIINSIGYFILFLLLFFVYQRRAKNNQLSNATVSTLSGTSSHLCVFVCWLDV
jgi:hypothetical protein